MESECQQQLNIGDVVYLAHTDMYSHICIVYTLKMENFDTETAILINCFLTYESIKMREIEFQVPLKFGRWGLLLDLRTEDELWSSFLFTKWPFRFLITIISARINFALIFPTHTDRHKTWNCIRLDKEKTGKGGRGKKTYPLSDGKILIKSENK